MDTSHKSQTRIKSANNDKSDVGKAAADLLNDGKKLGNALYEQGVDRVHEVEDNLKDYSDKILKKVQQNPLTSVLIAGGIGFLLSSLLKK
ncbi:hypothetical protein EP47_10575 [Legionella norrlandica]|uniref:DUF883 domain-containing protein n=1 Tax=Legionella norrlandica TaxID=1498499 RepID=A0A0A2SPI1_9GAMM|nr:hypothetical protein [Legionella norrlandica]KGP62662.1 hypothetical protein EP47_10575 [Legionella norrlandica]